MTELFNGGEMDAFSPSDGTASETITNTRYNSTFARCAISFGGYGGSSVSYIETAHWSAQTEAYFHFELESAQVVTTDTIISLLNASDVAVVRLRVEATGTYRLQYLNGAATWADAGSFTATSSLTAFDIHWKFDVSGELDVYLAGTSRIAFTGDLSHLTGVAYARLHNHYGWPHYSQVMADTEPTVGARLYTLAPSSAGANAAWTGTYTEVDEVAYSDADFINSGTADQVETFGVTPPTLTGYVVQSVTVSARAKTDGSGPANLQLALRSSSTDYFSASKALGIGYGPFQNIWTTNPATTAAWVNSAVSALQPGVKSIT